jgi:hypothetical protein
LEHRETVIASFRKSNVDESRELSFVENIISFLKKSFEPNDFQSEATSDEAAQLVEARLLISLLYRSTEELKSVITGLDGGYIKPAPGGGKGLYSCYTVQTGDFLTVFVLLLRQIYYEMDQAYYPQAVTFMQSTLIACRVPARG